MPEATLKRNISLPFLTLFGLGNILGAGIYVLIGAIAGAAGMYAPLAFLVASLVAGFTAVSYAELSARYPLSAGEAVYLQQGFSRRWLSVAAGLLVALGGMVSAATIANGFVGYLDVFIDLPDPLVIVLLVLSLGTVAAWGISESVRLAALFTLLEIGGLLLVLWVGRDSFAALPARLPELIPPPSPELWQGILMGAFLAFYAFIGFEDMVNVAEEVRQPQRNLPLAIFLALTIATLLYAGVALVAVLMVVPAELAATGAPLALLYETATGAKPVVITLVSLFAVVNGALIQIIMASRIAYGMSSQGWLPSGLARVNRRTHTPLFATAVVTLAVMLLALFFPLVRLASGTSFILLAVFMLVNLALLVIKRRDPTPPGVRTYPSWIPAIGFVSCLALTTFQLFSAG